MAFQVSPGVVTKEVDKTNVVPPVSSGIGVMVGHFSKGPVEEITIINSEEELVNTFGKPNSDNYEDWFTAANFLQYSSNLRVIRADAAAAKNAVGAGAAKDIKNRADYDTNGAAGSVWTAKTMGAHGNALKVSICAGANGFSQKYAAGTGGVNGAKAVGVTTVTVDSGTKFNVGDIITFDGTSGADTGHSTKYEVTDINGADLTIRQSDQVNGGGLTSAVLDNEEITRRWKFHDLFDSAPATSTWAADKGYVNDELHIVVYDGTGAITGFDGDAAGQRTASVLETFGFVSQAGIAKTSQGGSNFYVNVINDTSKYIYWGSHHSSISTDAGKSTPTDGTTYVQPSDNAQVIDTILSNGTDGSAPSVGEKKTSLDLIDNDTTEVDLIMAGSCGAGADGVTHGQNVVALAESRKDAVAFISPRSADVVGGATNSAKTTSVTTFFGNLNSSSYCVFDSGYKYMFDKYNDVYRYVPLNGDIAGITANTDLVADAWFSPAGYNRGGVRGTTKLAFNPSKAERDLLYQNRINPVCTFPGQGTVLFGDKTALSRPSAFDRINVRRLFLVLEKAISNAAKYQMFEFNDAFTRAQFVNLVEPFLRDVQGRRGISDFSVIADETNNTGEVIDRNEFVGDIFVKPARSINFVQLNFIAVRTGVAFSEIGG
tara:strand:- start:1139 stop:3112 length:1974 start_codon:yes stop_codon:yes gene_type:complete